MAMKLVVGLGNPGRKYEGTRHNVGFVVMARLAREHGGGKPRAAFDGEVVEVEFQGQRALLFCPHTFMNRSGQPVVKARDFYKLANEEVLIVCDDFNLPLGKLRARKYGSAGGHNGLADIIRQFGGEGVPRLRIGVGPVPDNWDPADFVLGRFTKEEQTEIEHAIARAADAVVVWARQGMDDCMNQFN
jgi:PTH1 family peptidyl-tRNA hydrolase